MVFFWGALCQPCIREMAYLEQIRGAAGASALEVIAVEGYGLARARVAQIMERYLKFNPRPSYAVVADPDRLLSRHFGVAGAFPQTFIIGGDGTVLYHTDEFVQGGERALADKIERVLGLAAGALSSGGFPKTPAASAPAAEESPTVLKGIVSKGEQHASSLVQAETLYRNWQYAAAIPHYRRCLELDPKSVAVRARLAEIFQRPGESSWPASSGSGCFSSNRATPRPRSGSTGSTAAAAANPAPRHDATERRSPPGGAPDRHAPSVGAGAGRTYCGTWAPIAGKPPKSATA